MAGIASHDHFLRMLKKLYVSKAYSNVQIKITEEDDSHAQVDLNSNSNLPQATPYGSETEEFVPIFIDAHALILHMNSPYFEKELINHKQGPSKLEITVKAGHGKYMEIIVSSFYDQDVLCGLDESDLLKVVQLACIYCNEEYVKGVSKLLEEKEVNVEMYNTILTSIWKFESSNRIYAGIMSKFKTKYTSYLAKLFSPIEEKYSEHRKFLEMEYASLLYLLKSDENLSISENSLITFIVLWLKHDSTRKTANIIEGLLGSIRIKFVSFNFLYYAIKFDNITFSHWDGYHRWFYHNLGALATLGPLKQKIYPTLDYQVSRNREFGIHAWYKDAARSKLNACRWLVQMTPEKPGEQFGPTEHLLVHDGFQFSPTLINITPMDRDESKFNMNLAISCTGSLADVRFVVGIVPADRDYDITSNKHFGSTFSQKFLKLTEPLTFKSDVQIIDFWTIDKGYIDHVNEHGMYVLLLPITDEEYKKLSIVHLCCGRGHTGSLTINNKCSIIYRVCSNSDNNICTSYPTSHLCKIHLTSTCDYSL